MANRGGYDAPPSIWAGSDADLLERMLCFYPTKPPQDILDATINAGRFWVGSTRKVMGLDIDPAHNPDVVGDNRDMPFDDGAFDAVVYDPPHVPNQGRDKRKDFRTRFGLGIKSGKAGGHSLRGLYGPFLAEAYRVLRPGGVCFAKIADYVHNHRYQWAHIDFITIAGALGFCACDCIIKTRASSIIDPKWKTAHHARRHHVYWIILRKSARCERG